MLASIYTLMLVSARLSRDLTGPQPDPVLSPYTQLLATEAISTQALRVENPGAAAPWSKKGWLSRATGQCCMERLVALN